MLLICGVFHGDVVQPGERSFEIELVDGGTESIEAKPVAIAGQSEFEQGTWQVKDLKAGQQTTVTEADLVEALKRLIAAH